MKHIIPLILLLSAIAGVACGTTSMILAFSIGKQNLLYIPAVMLTVVAAVINITTLVSSIFLRSRLCKIAAVISAAGVAIVVVAFIVLAAL